MTKSLTAQDIMNPEVMTVTNEMTVKELAGFLTDQEISGAPVEDENGALIGVVSVTDIVRAASSGGDRLMNGHDREAHFYTRGWEGKLSADELETLHLEDDELKVGEIMTPSVFAVEAEAPINTVAQSMMDSHLHRLLVVREGKVVGIVSTSDLLSLLAEID
jgi:CBS domain-containing protein